jgi:hypothetical protein
MYGPLGLEVVVYLAGRTRVQGEVDSKVCELVTGSNAGGMCACRALVAPGTTPDSRCLHVSCLLWLPSAQGTRKL